MFMFNSACASKLQLSSDRVNLLSAGVAELSDEHLAKVNGGTLVGDVVGKIGDVVAKNISTRVGNTISAVANVINVAAGEPSQGPCPK